MTLDKRKVREKRKLNLVAKTTRQLTILKGEKKHQQPL